MYGKTKSSNEENMVTLGNLTQSKTYKFSILSHDEKDNGQLGKDDSIQFNSLVLFIFLEFRQAYISNS